jgi:biopolymer transport protein ExbB/TolQ
MSNDAQAAAQRPESAQPPLSWRLNDIEHKLIFPSRPFTQAGGILTLIMGVLGASGVYGLLFPFPDRVPRLFALMTERGWTQYAVCLLFFWGAAILLIKWLKLSLQVRSLKIQIVPDDPSFTLSPMTTNDVLASMHRQVDDPQAFTLFNRIRRALLSLKNMGRVSDVDTVMRAQADGDANLVESSYSLVRTFLWAMPVLGFIGTVVGLSAAIGGFSDTLSGASEMVAVRDKLKIIVQDLAVAFDTTFLALIATLILQLLMSVLKKREDDFLTACDDYCHRAVITRLRLLPHEELELWLGDPMMI